jgi:hypothetical protein
MKLRFALAVTALTAYAAPALAEPITEGVWKLENRGVNDNGRAGFYRFKGNGEGFDLYDFESNGADVRMVYDANAGTINVSGQAYDTAGDRLVSFDLDYTGVTVEGNRVKIGESTTVGVFDGVEVMSKRSSGNALYLDSAGLETSLSGSAWLGTADGHFGDFHIAGTRIADLNPQAPNTGAGTGGGSVPAPGGLALLVMGGLALVGLRRRQQRANKD